MIAVTIAAHIAKIQNCLLSGCFWGGGSCVSGVFTGFFASQYGQKTASIFFPSGMSNGSAHFRQVIFMTANYTGFPFRVN